MRVTEVHSLSIFSGRIVTCCHGGLALPTGSPARTVCGLIAHSPSVHVRRPRIDYESHAIGLDRDEVGTLLVAAGLGPAAEHALISLLALNGLRVSLPSRRAVEKGL
jgi:hypothetical protein